MSSGPTGPVIWPADARAALSNPETSGETLALIAAQYPGLRDEVAQHPRAYPELRQWISQASPQPPASVATPDATPLAAPVATPATGSPLRWLFLAVGVLVVVIGLVVALVWWSPWSVPAAPPSGGGRPSSNVSSSTSPDPHPPAPQPTAGPVTETETSAYRGSATQSTTSAKVWGLSVSLSDNYGLIDYALPGSDKTCRGVLTRGSNGAWLERITEGDCDDKGSWTFAGVGKDHLTGTYRPPAGSYRVTATLERISGSALAVINAKVSTERCSNDPPQPISTVVVMDGSVIALIDHGSGAPATYRGPRNSPTDYLNIVGEDSSIYVGFESATSSKAVVVADC